MNESALSRLLLVWAVFLRVWRHSQDGLLAYHIGFNGIGMTFGQMSMSAPLVRPNAMRTQTVSIQTEATCVSVRTATLVVG